MRSDYPLRALGEIVRLEYGKPLPQSDRTTEESIPAYGANGILCWSRKAFRKEPSIIVGRKGSAGEVTLTEGAFWPTDVTYFVEHDKKETDLKYLFYLLKFLNLPKLAKGVKPGINRNDVYALNAPIPPLSEQKRIVAVLDEAFAGIAKASDNNARNLENARELFEATLRHEIGKAISDSKMLTLAEISKDFGRGRSRHRPRNDKSLYGGDYPFIQTGDIRNSGHFIEGYSQTYNKKGLAQSKLWPKGTICITIAANIAETGVLTFDACFPDSVIGVVVDPAKAVSDYVEYALQYFKAELQAQGKGSAQDNINMGTFENARFPFPSLDRQIAIVEKLSVLEAHCRRLAENYQAKSGAMGELKQSLLHQAFSGKLTGKEAEAA